MRPTTVSLREAFVKSYSTAFVQLSTPAPTPVRSMARGPVSMAHRAQLRCKWRNPNRRAIPDSAALGTDQYRPKDVALTLANAK